MSYVNIISDIKNPLMMRWGSSGCKNANLFSSFAPSRTPPHPLIWLFVPIHFERATANGEIPTQSRGIQLTSGGNMITQQWSLSQSLTHICYYRAGPVLVELKRRRGPRFLVCISAKSLLNQSRHVGCLHLNCRLREECWPETCRQSSVSQSHMEKANELCSSQELIAQMELREVCKWRMCLNQIGNCQILWKKIKSVLITCEGTAYPIFLCGSSVVEETLSAFA